VLSASSFLLVLTAWLHLSGVERISTGDRHLPFSFPHSDQDPHNAFPDTDTPISNLTETSHNSLNAKPKVTAYNILELNLGKDEQEWNARQMVELESCIKMQEEERKGAESETRCHPNRTKVVLFASIDTFAGLWNGWRRGESIWYVDVPP